MKKLIYVLVAVVALAAAFVGWRMMAPPPDDLDLARSKQTQAGMFTVAIAPESEPVRQGPLHSWIVTVTTPDGAPVEDATISVDGGMPQHGHGLPTAPAMTAALGEGRYRIEGVRFNMGGWWELKLAIAADGRSDDVTFNLVL
ncbi:auxin-binding protein [Aquibium carbonis]|uniref:Auxin-binding protein n=2 Tax=Aquibium carbonis TaxID=2495581 RepID=A0A3R9ZMW5_9HYPH|nr:auxin-binding protein [Aquibium carbonis]